MPTTESMTNAVRVAVEGVEVRVKERTAALAAIPAKHAQPDPSTLATLPKGNVSILYMGHAEVTLALIDVDPLWTWEPLAIDSATGGPMIHHEGNRLVMWARLTVCGKSIIGVGTCEARKGDPEKELVGDFLRNAAMRFGIGTKLWSKATDADPVGREPEPTYSKKAIDAFELCKQQADEVKRALREFAEENGRKVSVAAFDADPGWGDMAVAFIREQQK